MIRPNRSTAIYNVIRKIYLDPHSDRKEIKEEVENGEEALNKTIEKNIIEVRNGEFVLNDESLVNYWVELWSKEVGMEMDPEDVKRDFIIEYVEAYLTDVARSTTDEMLVRNFFHGLKSYCNTDVADDWLNMWFLTLKQNYEASESPDEIIKNAVKRVEYD